MAHRQPRYPTRSQARGPSNFRASAIRVEPGPRWGAPRAPSRAHSPRTGASLDPALGRAPSPTRRHRPRSTATARPRSPLRAALRRRASEEEPGQGLRRRDALAGSRSGPGISPSTSAHPLGEGLRARQSATLRDPVLLRRQDARRADPRRAEFTLVSSNAWRGSGNPPASIQDRASCPTVREGDWIPQSSRPSNGEPGWTLAHKGPA